MPVRENPPGSHPASTDSRGTPWPPLAQEQRSASLIRFLRVSCGLCAAWTTSNRCLRHDFGTIIIISPCFNQGYEEIMHLLARVVRYQPLGFNGPSNGALVTTRITRWRTTVGQRDTAPWPRKHHGSRHTGRCSQSDFAASSNPTTSFNVHPKSWSMARTTFMALV